MNMGAYLLPALCSAKDPNHRDFRLVLRLSNIGMSRDLGVKIGGSSLIVIDAVKSYTERIHEGSVEG